jgi:hypothetical protein
MDTRPTLYCQAFRAAKNGKIVAMVESLIGSFDEEGLSNPAQTRRAVLEKLAQLSQDEQVPSAVQLQASVWLGRANHVRLFTEQSQSDQNDQDPEDVRAELAEAIRELFTPTPSTTPVHGELQKRPKMWQFG